MTRLKISLMCLILSVMACTQPVKIQATPTATKPAVMRVHPMHSDPANVTAIECDPCE